MASQNRLLLKILKSTSLTKERTGQMNIIVQRPYDILINELKSVFKGQEDVIIRVDRRNGERRTKKKPVPSERRRADRRSAKEILVEAVISF